MTGKFSCSGGVAKTSKGARGGRAMLLLAASLLALPEMSRAECFERMSRIPVSAPAGPEAPKFRLNMLRTSPAASPAATPRRPRATKAKAAGQATHKARPVRKASYHRPAHRKPAGLHRAVAHPPTPSARPSPRPTPMPVAERELATPRSFALIQTTVCESNPGAAAAPEVSTPVLAIAPAPADPPVIPIPATDTDNLLFPFLSPGGGPGFPGGPTFVPGGPTPGGPPRTTTPKPPITPPDEGPEDKPPVTPPDEGPPIVVPPEDKPPPTGKPPPTLITEIPVLPPTAPIPEPATWALMIVGFGMLGARMRRLRPQT